MAPTHTSKCCENCGSTREAKKNSSYLAVSPCTLCLHNLGLIPIPTRFGANIMGQNLFVSFVFHAVRLQNKYYPLCFFKKQSCLSLFRWFGATCVVQCCWFHQRNPPCSAPGLTVYSLIAVVNFTMCQTTWGSSRSCLTFTPNGQKSLPWLQSTSAAVISYLDQLLPKRMPCAINTDNGPQFPSSDFIVYLTGKGITS